MPDIPALQKRAMQLRRDALDAVYAVQSGHLGGSFSAADIVAALYFYKMRIDPKNPKWEDRDRFVLSKGHAAPILYAALARAGFFDISEMKRLRQADSFLQGATSFKTPGIDMSSGPLGQGLSAGVGMALAARCLKKSFHTYVMIGDGEFQEGQIWEAFFTAAKYGLDNLTCILDNNGIQMNGTNEEVMPIGNPAEKLRTFGWDVVSIDGHDMHQIVDALDRDNRSGKPRFIAAHTVKGKGVPFMENSYKWHGKPPDREQYEQAAALLRGDAYEG